MDTTAKQRVLGIIVLLALLGIVLTVLLHNSREDRARATVASQSAATNAAATNTEINTSDQNLNNINTALNNEVQAQQAAQAANNSLSIPNSNNQTLEQQASGNSAITAAPSSIANSNSSIDINNTTAITPHKTSSAINHTTQIAAPTITPTTNTTTHNSDSVSIPAIKSTLPPVTVQTSQALSSTPKKQSTIHASIPKTKTIVEKSSAHTATTTPVAQSISHETSASLATTTATNSKDFTVQAGTFDVPDDAINLVKTLKAHGFIARTEKVSTDKGEMTRVTVGPMAQTEDSAKALNEKLKSEMHISGMIVSKETHQ